jgi:hypothetical protein
MTLLATQITRTLADLVSTCTTARGYASNTGASVQVGQIRGTYRQAPAAFVLPGRQSGGGRYGEVREVTREIQVRAFADLNDHPALDEIELIDLVIWDLRRCIESYDESLAALVQRIRYVSDLPGYREEGGTIVGAALTYEIVYLVSITDPETAA